jgi:hypothetical protein
LKKKIKNSNTIKKIGRIIYYQVKKDKKIDLKYSSILKVMNELKEVDNFNISHLKKIFQKNKNCLANQQFVSGILKK